MWVIGLNLSNVCHVKSGRFFYMSSVLPRFTIKAAQIFQPFCLTFRTEALWTSNGISVYFSRAPPDDVEAFYRSYVSFSQKFLGLLSEALRNHNLEVFLKFFPKNFKVDFSKLLSWISDIILKVFRYFRIYCKFKGLGNIWINFCSMKKCLFSSSLLFYFCYSYL